MNKEQQIFWWETFCNSCKSEDCKSCNVPEVDTYFDLMTVPSNWEELNT